MSQVSKRCRNFLACSDQLTGIEQVARIGSVALDIRNVDMPVIVYDLSHIVVGLESSWMTKVAYDFEYKILVVFSDDLNVFIGISRRSFSR